MRDSGVGNEDEVNDEDIDDWNCGVKDDEELGGVGFWFGEGEVVMGCMLVLFCDKVMFVKMEYLWYVGISKGEWLFVGWNEV